MTGTTSVQLGRRTVTASGRPYVIAEIGVNHEGSLDQGRRLIDLAKQGGADAAKFQTYKAETLASKHSPSYWDTSKEATRSQYQLFKRYDAFGPDDYVALAEHCRQQDIEFLSTPFDVAAVELLDPLVSFFKVASADLTNVPFLRHVGAKGKPVVLSTGASTLAEIDTAIEIVTQAGCTDIVLLHCVLNYPTEDANAHLRMITGLKRAYPDRLVGYSDHTVPDDAMTALVVAHLLGAVVIEKHFTHDKALPGNDHYHAMDVADLTGFTSLIDRIHTLLGPSDRKAPIATEAAARLNARRSIVLARDVPSGHRLEARDFTYKRPGVGIGPEHWDAIIGRLTARALHADEILYWDSLASSTPTER